MASSSKRARIESSSSSSESSSSEQLEEELRPPTESEILQKEEERVMKKFFIKREFEAATTDLAKIKPDYPSEYYKYLYGVLSYLEGKIEGLFTLAEMAEQNLLSSYTFHLISIIFETKVLPYLQGLNKINQSSYKNICHRSPGVERQHWTFFQEYNKEEVTCVLCQIQYQMYLLNQRSTKN